MDLVGKFFVWLSPSIFAGAYAWGYIEDVVHGQHGYYVLRVQGCHGAYAEPGTMQIASTASFVGGAFLLYDEKGSAEGKFDKLVLEEKERQEKRRSAGGGLN